MKEKLNKDRANEEFVRAVGAAIHDRLVYVIRGFPEFEEIPQFYREMAEILYGVDKIKQSLGAVGWAAKHTKMVGHEIARTDPEVFGDPRAPETGGRPARLNGSPNRQGSAVLK